MLDPKAFYTTFKRELDELNKTQVQAVLLYLLHNSVYGPHLGADAWESYVVEDLLIELQDGEASPNLKH